MNMLIKTKHTSDERGFASIVIALVLIVVLSLVTVGFAQLARHEQRSALDKQLADQAYYAAESGINDTLKVLSTIPQNNNPNTCLSSAILPNSTIGVTANGVSYTCVLVTLKPNNLKYDNVAAQSGRHVTFSTDLAASKFVIGWGSVSGNTNFPATPSGFTPQNSWGHPGVVQLSITPLAATDRNSLVRNTFTAYLYPARSGNDTVVYNPAGNAQGSIVSGDCSTTNHSSNYPCEATISGFSGTGPYLISFVNYYDDSNVIISGKTAADQAVRIVDGQKQIDATGKAKNVLKRLQVRIDPESNPPLFTLEAQNICKRFGTAPATSDNPTGTSFDIGTSPACKLSDR